MARLIREITQDLTKGTDDYRWQGKAINALHEAAEVYVTKLLETAQFAAIQITKSGSQVRKTLKAQDMVAVRYIFDMFSQ